mgnify:CR=1 FL=1
MVLALVEINKLFLTALDDSKRREDELKQELSDTEDARQSTFDKYVDLKKKYGGIGF